MFKYWSPGLSIIHSVKLYSLMTCNQRTAPTPKKLKILTLILNNPKNIYMSPNERTNDQPTDQPTNQPTNHRALWTASQLLQMICLMWWNVVFAQFQTWLSVCLSVSLPICFFTHTHRHRHTHTHTFMHQSKFYISVSSHIHTHIDSNTYTPLKPPQKIDAHIYIYTYASISVL